MNRRKNIILSGVLLVVVLLVVITVLVQSNTGNSRDHAIDTGNMSYGVISYMGEYRRIDGDKAKELADILFDAIAYSDAEMSPTNGMVKLEDHVFVEDKEALFTIELVLEEPQKVWVKGGKDTETWIQNDVQGIFFSPAYSKAVINFASDEERIESGDYSMEYAEMVVDDEKLEVLSEEIQKMISN